MSEILSGFDVDCSCFLFDGSQVFGSPRGIAAFLTQTNSIDLTRRSPSYESRLSKYAHRGFEVHWPELDRSKIDPTIFERSFARTNGLARLLVLEQLPMPDDRELYLEQRRKERARPPSNIYARRWRTLPGNVKDQDPNDVAEWIYDDEISNYHSFTVPYGPKYHARKIEKLLYSKDLLLNAEWNEKKDRKVNLHRHPCFIGDIGSVIHDCCGLCPQPENEEDHEIASEESKIYVSGDLEFMKDDPGRQAIGSFHPLTQDDWTEMAYIGNTEELCQMICDGNLGYVKEWCLRSDTSIDRRDCTGRTPLHLAIQSSTPEIVACLVDNGARIVARLVDGMTALHLAAARGNSNMVRTLLERSEANEEEEAEKEAQKKAPANSVQNKEAKDIELSTESDSGTEGSDLEEVDPSSDDKSTTMTDGSFVKIQREEDKTGTTLDDSESSEADQPDVYDINLVAWDIPVSPLHIAILGGHIEVIELLISSFGADVLLPIKHFNAYTRRPQTAIMSLVLAAQLTEPDGSRVCKKLLSLGASTAQADMKQITALHYLVATFKSEAVKVSFDVDFPAAKASLSHVVVENASFRPFVDTPLTTAICSEKTELVKQVLKLGAPPTIELDDFARSYSVALESESYNFNRDREISEVFRENTVQPVLHAIDFDMPDVVYQLLELGADVNSIDPDAHQYVFRAEKNSSTYLCGNSLLDMINNKIDTLRKAGAEAMDIPDPPYEAYFTDQHERTLLQQGKVEHCGRCASQDCHTYEQWHLLKDTEQIDYISRSWKKQKVDKVDEYKSQPGLKEKIAALDSLRQKFDRLRDHVIAVGGKTLEEMYSGIPMADHGNNRLLDSKKKLPRKGVFFRISPETNILHEGYMQLFQATWENDIGKVKTLTLAPWGEGEYPPLQIAIQDMKGFSPFAIALYRGHIQLARSILDIATAQYSSIEHDSPRRRYALNEHDDSDQDTGSQSDDLDITSDLVDDVFTINNIAALPKSVASKISGVYFPKEQKQNRDLISR